MSQEDRRSLSRRAYLAAGATGVALLAGCPEQEGSSTEADGRAGTEIEGGIQPGNQPGVSEGAGEINPVHVDMVGYRPDDEKTGVVAAEAETFQVLDDSGEVVAEGDLSDPIDDANSGDTVRYADFSDVTEPGTYQLAVDDESETSQEFEIDEGVWGQTLANVCRGFTFKRSGTEFSDDVFDLIRYGPGHEKDAEARMYFGNEVHDKDENVDVSGGWYDGGDYGKYVPSAAITVGQMLLAYEQNPDTFETDQFKIDAALASGGGGSDLPDLLREVKFELEWLEKMQRPDGSVYLKVGGMEWPGPAVPPSEDDQERFVFGLSTYGTALYAGAMAMAARVYADHDQEFADRALENAESAWSYLQDNPEPHFREDPGQNDGTNPYKKETDAEDRLWAAAELLRTTGEASYAEYVQSQHADLLTGDPAPLEAGNAVLLGQWAYYNADGGSSDLQDQVESSFVNYADGVVDHVESEGYNVALTEDEYTWDSNKITLGKANILILANEMSADESYLARARDQIHYVLGRTPTGMSYVTLAGGNFPLEPHDRIRLGVDVHFPGLVVGGPNADGGDPTLDDFIEQNDPAPAKAYVDGPVSWGGNETGINHSAPLLFALAHFTPADAIEPGANRSVEVTQVSAPGE